MAISMTKATAGTVKRVSVMTIALAAILLTNVWPVRAADWPTRLHDIRRGGVTSEPLFGPLTQKWVYKTSRKPGPAWTESPAVHDYLHDHYDLKPRQHFDRCFDVAVVGDFVHFGSSRSGAITCLNNAAGGREVWTFFTGGPVRFAPQVVDGKVYAGSDDGYVYCLNASDGALLWSQRAGPSDDMIWGNENMISVWPVRSSVLVDGGDVFWSAGIFPEEGTFLCKRKAADGTGGWTVRPKRPIQGYLLATDKLLIAPTGKTYPFVYSRENGSNVGTIKSNGRDGGCWALLTPEGSEIWTGPTVKNASQKFSASSRTAIASVPNANCLVVDSAFAYYATDSQLVKIRRSDHKPVWKRDSAYRYALIKAGETLFAGGDGEVAAFDADGKRVWKAAVDGKVYGLAAANGCLFVSTDTGSIYSFGMTVPNVSNEQRAGNVTAHAAEVAGQLLSQGGAPCEVLVYWGTSDGGTKEGKWSHFKNFGRCGKEVFCKLTELEERHLYYYRFQARNSYGSSWAESSGVFMTGPISIQASDDKASEDAADAGVVTVSRPAWASDAAMTVRYTVSGTATAGTDYQPLDGTVTIPKGQTSAPITVTPMRDMLIDEPVMTVCVTLARGAYMIGTSAGATIRITDNDSIEEWAHKMKITFPGYDRSETLIDFPALVVFSESLPGFSYSQFASSDGGDLRFTDQHKAQLLHYEIERWDTSGRSYVWVQVPALAPKDTCIWAFWGNAKQAKRPEHMANSRTWSRGYKGVWHLSEAGGVHADSSPGRNGGKAENGVDQAAAGIVAGADRFDGDDDQIALTKLLPIGATANTVTLWVKVPKAGSAGLKASERVGVVLGNYNSRPNSNWELLKAGEMRTFWNGGQIDQHGKTDVRDDAWHHLAWVRDKAAGKFYMYFDGRLVKTIETAGDNVAFATTHKIGGDNRPAGPPNFHGLMDEMRVSDVARSADWIRACWQNQKTPDQFIRCEIVK